MTKKKQKSLYCIACVLSAVCIVYQIGQAVAELPNMLVVLRLGTASLPEILLSAALALVHIAVAVLLAVTAFRFRAHKESERWLGAVAVIKAVSFLLELVNYHDGLPGQIVEIACCVLLSLYALCCFHVIRRPSLLIPLETVLLLIGYCSSLFVVVQHMLFTTHASYGAVLLAALCDPLSTAVMLLLAIGYHLLNDE